MVKREITAQIIEHCMRRVVQVVEPEAERFLTEKGGKVTHYDLHEMHYREYYPLEDHRVLYWPPETVSVYVSPRGQEDNVVIFAIFLLPASTQELHIVYDYRLNPSNGPFEEYFTLRIAQEHEYVLRAL